ncbi:aminotransferase class I/II-fold pyridoxal phosphate-dependent enzyme [Robiginitalea sp.]|jgi:L-2,4-diaminobutyrate decarboxylase|nr:aminotransferase class I/II-fold pyridoxal phosphate-dependent enzyme [Robiginitalea sp.]
MNTPHLDVAFDPEQFRKSGHELIDLLANQLEDNIKGSGPSIRYNDPESELAYWRVFLNNPQAEGLAEAFLARTTQVRHPRYMGHQVAAPLPLASLAALLGASQNNGMAVYEMGMAPAAMERIVTDWLCEKAGFGTQARGFLTSGGTLANLTGLLAARRARGKQDVWNAGYNNSQAVLVSEAAHYCVDRAARIMGMGVKGVIKVPVDTEFRMDISQLESCYQQALKDGLEPIAVVGSAPCTATGSYDPIAKIADFCESHHLWLHIDGAHGGAAFLSQKYGHLVEGINRADSVVIDGHKMLGMPVLTTALLFRNGVDSYTTFSQEAAYLLNATEDEDWYNLAKRTFECTKLTSSVTWFAVLKQYGESIFTELIDRQYDLGQKFADLIQMRSGWELACQPDANILCFRLTPKGLNTEECNRLNEAVRKKLLEHGNFYIVQTRLNGISYLRTSLMSPNSQESHLVELLEEIEKIALGLHSPTPH